MEHPNADVVRAWNDAVAARDLETARSLLHESVVFHIGGSNPVTGDYFGRDQVLNDFFRRLTHVYNRIDVDLHDVLANEDHVVALIDRRMHRGSRTFETHAIGIYHVHGGRISEVWIHETDQPGVDEFASS